METTATTGKGQQELE